MKLSKRQWSLGALLAATLGAVAWVSGGDPAGDQSGAVANPARPGSAAASRRAAAAGDDSVMNAVEPQRLIRVVGQRKVGDPFNATSFLPPVPPPKPAITVSAPPPPPPPVATVAPVRTAPAFPWTFMGRMIEDPQNPAVFLSRSERLTVAHLGDLLENSWKVVGMDARGLRVEYLPLKSTQTVNLPNGSDVTGNVSSATIAAQAAAQAAVAQQSLQQLGAQEAQAQQQDSRPVATAAPAPAPSPVSGIDISSSFGAPPQH